MNVTLKTGVVLLGGALVGLLAGCSASSPDTASTTTVTTTATAAPTAGPAASAPAASTPGDPSADASPSCGPSSGADAAAGGISALPLPAGLSGNRWDAANADYSGYDACAALSWSVVTLAGSTSSSPYAILLFHDGSYLGTATSTPYAFTPDVSRTSDDTLAITYRYPKGSDSNADPTGRSKATVTWNASTDRVQFAGQTPPSS